MSNRHGDAVLRVIRTVAAKLGEDQVSDRDLLRRFVEQHDEDAFAALVRRHAPMVMGVGLRVLRQHQDAEDVCQATFLLLAKKAHATAWRDSIANWLYEVAYHLALKTRQATNRRNARARKVQAKTPPDPLADITLADLQRVLDEELSRLAKKYRTPLILCYLEGKTRDEAARFLGLPLTTVNGRLEAGRELLRRRLAGRGVPFSLMLAGVTLLSATADAMPATFIRATSQAALQVVAGKVLTNVVSMNVSLLFKGGIQAMFITKLKVAAACGLVLAVASAVAWAALPTTSAQEPHKQSPVLFAAGDKSAGEQKPQPGAKRDGPGILLLARRDGIVTLTPEGKDEADVMAPKDTRGVLQGALSPDGTRVAHIVVVNGGLKSPGNVGEERVPWSFKVVVLKLGAADSTAVADLPAHGLTLTWAADGKRLVVTKETVWQKSYETILLDPATGKTEPLGLPAGVRVLDAHRDGKTFLVFYPRDKKYRLGLAAKGDKEVRELTELKAIQGIHVGRISPDGTKVLYTDGDPADKDAHYWGMSSKPYLLDVATKKREPLAEFPENAQALGVAWSPDGKRVAYTSMQLHPDLLKKDTLDINDATIETESFLTVADANGKNAKRVSSAKGDYALNRIYGSIDWR
jgi:RNA polymerase sigma factor (sigma-70 family)